MLFIRRRFKSFCSLLSYRLSRRPCRIYKKDGAKLSAQEVGALGERIAADHLSLHGRKVLYRNYRGPRGGEIDIVARDGRR